MFEKLSMIINHDMLDKKLSYIGSIESFHEPSDISQYETVDMSLFFRSHSISQEDNKRKNAVSPLHISWLL